VAALDAACVARDGGRLKLEYGVLRSRPGTRTDDLCWTAGGELVGFLGLYQFSSEAAEVCGMVHPEWRRRGIFTALLDEGLAELRRRRTPRALLVVHRGFDAGAALAAKLGARLEHSEHRMRQLRAPAPLGPGESIVLRPAIAGDAGDETFVRSCLVAAFGSADFGPDGGTEAGTRIIEAGTRIIEDHGEPVGVMHLDRDSPTVASIYGFGVLPEWQGRGIGRRALVQASSEVRADGVEEVLLEVEVRNDSALRLYERCGFERRGTEDYYEVLLDGAGGDGGSGGSGAGA